MSTLSGFTCTLLHICRFPYPLCPPSGSGMNQLPDHAYKSVFCGHCGHVIRVPVYCHDRFCPMCSKARAWKIRSRMTELLKSTVLEPGQGFKLLTLTLKNQPDLAPMVKQLLHSFRLMRHRKFWKRSFSGGCFVIEVTGHAGYWHAHLHILLQGSYLPQRILLQHWRKINGSGGVYIQKITKKSVIFYLTKYLTKECEEGSDNKQISSVLKDFRLFQPFGLWHGLIPPYKKKSMPCPDCGCKVWVPEHTIFAFARSSSRTYSRDPTLGENAKKRLNSL